MLNLYSSILSLFFLFSSLNVFCTDALVTEQESISLIYTQEAEEDLEKNESTNLQTALSNFLKKGGTLIRMDGETPPFHLLPNDVVFPSCSGGVNRSQTLWNILRPYEGIIVLNLPHATRQSFDPYNGKENWNRLRKIPRQDDEFFQWAGVVKSKRFGFDVFQEYMVKETVTESEKAMMRKYYNDRYYNPNLAPDTRRVYITFAQNAHVHLHRLSETNSSLENVTLLFYPLPDLISHPKPESQIRARSLQAYQDFAEKIEKYLDFSKL